jgi:hypothetical protein
MKHEVVASIQFSEALREHWPTGRFLGLARFATDDSDHPQGRWSIGIEPWSTVGPEGRVQAWVAFVSPDAPQHLLQCDTTFKIFVGVDHVADAM